MLLQVVYMSVIVALLLLAVGADTVSFKCNQIKSQQACYGDCSQGGSCTWNKGECVCVVDKCRGLDMKLCNGACTATSDGICLWDKSRKLCECYADAPLKCEELGEEACGGVCPEDRYSKCKWDATYATCICLGSRGKCKDNRSPTSCVGVCPEDPTTQCYWDTSRNQCDCFVKNPSSCSEIRSPALCNGFCPEAPDNTCYWDAARSECTCYTSPCDKYKTAATCQAVACSDNPNFSCHWIAAHQYCTCKELVDKTFPSTAPAPVSSTQAPVFTTEVPPLPTAVPTPEPDNTVAPVTPSPSSLPRTPVPVSTQTPVFTTEVPLSRVPAPVPALTPVPIQAPVPRTPSPVPTQTPVPTTEAPVYRTLAPASAHTPVPTTEAPVPPPVPTTEAPDTDTRTPQHAGATPSPDSTNPSPPHLTTAPKHTPSPKDPSTSAPTTATRTPSVSPTRRDTGAPTMSPSSGFFARLSQTWTKGNWSAIKRSDHNVMDLMTTRYAPPILGDSVLRQGSVIHVSNASYTVSQALFVLGELDVRLPKLYSEREPQLAKVLGDTVIIRLIAWECNHMADGVQELLLIEGKCVIRKCFSGYAMPNCTPEAEAADDISSKGIIAAVAGGVFLLLILLLVIVIKRRTRKKKPNEPYGAPCDVHSDHLPYGDATSEKFDASTDVKRRATHIPNE